MMKKLFLIFLFLLWIFWSSTFALEYCEKTQSSSTTITYTSSASSYYPTFDPFKAFWDTWTASTSDPTAWASNSSACASWEYLQIQFSTAVPVYSYRISRRAWSSTFEFPKAWDFIASNDWSTRRLLERRSNQTPSDWNFLNYSYSTGNTYSYFRLVFTDKNTSCDRFAVWEWDISTNSDNPSYWFIPALTTSPQTITTTWTSQVLWYLSGDLSRISSWVNYIVYYSWSTSSSTGFLLYYNWISESITKNLWLINTTFVKSSSWSNDLTFSPNPNNTISFNSLPVNYTWSNIIVSWNYNVFISWGVLFIQNYITSWSNISWYTLLFTWALWTWTQNFTWNAFEWFYGQGLRFVVVNYPLIFISMFGILLVFFLYRVLFRKRQF